MSDTETKKHAASDRKLSKQREEGSIPNAQDSVGMFSTASGLTVSIALAVSAWQMLVNLIIETPQRFLENFDEAVEASFDTMLDTMLLVLLPSVASVLIVSIISTLIINKGIVFATKPVTPDLKRVSITAGLKRVFGKRGWTELLVATLRLTIWVIFSSLVSIFLVVDILKSVNCDGYCQFAIAYPIVMSLLIGSIAFLLIAAGADIIVQKKIFMSEQKMTETERKRERKDQSGSPEIQQERNRLKQTLEATAGIALQPSQATILFTGKSGAVGINYDPPKQNLPLICAKAKAGTAADALIKRLTDLGIPMMKHDGIVNNTIGKGNSEMLDVLYFEDFARALAAV